MRRREPKLLRAVPPATSILIPTRRRRDYLAVALGRLRDLRANVGTSRTRRRLAKAARSEPKRRVLVLSIVRPQNPRAVAEMGRELGASHHDALLPFPDLQMGWGLDAHWGALAAQRGWKLGVVDVVPVRHARPVAVSYPRDAAMAEADRYLADRPYVTREQAAEVLEEYRD